jgi:hypothetical protein
MLNQHTIESAVLCAGSHDMVVVGAAREFAENLGYAAFRTKEGMPPAFMSEPVLRAGFEEGLSNAQCEHEQVRAGLL